MSTLDLGWHTYAVPVRIEREGVVYVRARSSDEAVQHVETLSHEQLDEQGSFEDSDLAQVTDSPEIDDEETWAFHVDERAELTMSDINRELEKALHDEHCDPCFSCTACPNTCDIHEAYDCDLFVLAADIFVNATSEGTEATEKALLKIRDTLGDKSYEALLQEQRNAFSKMVNDVRCKACNSVVYLDDGEDRGICGDCNTSVEKEHVTNERIQAAEDNADLPDDEDDENDGCD